MIRTAETKAADEAVALAIDKDKGSQHAIKWAVDHLLTKGQPLTLLHVKHTLPNHEGEEGENVYKKPVDAETKELFLPFRSFCKKKLIKCHEVVVEAVDIPKALINYVISNSIEILVLGAPSRHSFFRSFKVTDVPSCVIKGVPNFCTLYVIGKGKISNVQTATIPPPKKARNQIHKQSSKVSESNGTQSMRKQQPRGRASMNNSYDHSPESTDISFVSSGRPSIDRMFTPRKSISPEFDNRSSASSYSRRQFIDKSSSPQDFSSSSMESGKSWSSSHNMDEVEAEMWRLKLELKQTMDVYKMACKEAVTLNHEAQELDRWKSEEEHRLNEAHITEEAALALIKKEREKCKAAMEAAEAAQRIAELEAHKRRNAEMKALKEAEERNQATEARAYNLRYRKYTIEEIEAGTNKFSQTDKVGEGGYGPVYRGELDHTQVAVKILRPGAAQGHSQFQQEVEVLSCIRHPNMVLLLGACPEYGCLVYEYMANGSLEDRLFQRGNTPVIPWQLRFRISAEIATGLLFLHQSKPEPLVHRDLKPGNILLDHNYVSKISDVGLARLVPPSVADSVTQYRMTSTAGTFCYIDPEYQQTGMLGTKSDIYSLGVMLLQIITAKPPMGLAHHVELAIELGTFAEMLDPAVPDWPIEEALSFAKLSLQCTEMRRKDRPDLAKVVLPELNRLRALAEDSMHYNMLGGSSLPSPLSASATLQISGEPSTNKLAERQELNAHAKTGRELATEM
ncbi:U-box domain-containing protein 52-like [Prunus dulcis]|uniref:U-box domain-containing protein 52-like n=1 Tax=Prunus dulcis TaxID=3755 RepID=UPI001482D167|nr:U-box domain-containing protein 52-like [Prunus dulcis]